MNLCKNCDKKCAVQFCSRSCNISFQNKYRDTSFSKTLKHANCVVCNVELRIKKQQSLASARCQQCKLARQGRPHKSSTKLCADCQCSFIAKYAKFCLTCRKLRQANSGRKSAASQASTRRSWSEIELGKLCQAHFLDVTFNDPIFPNDPPTETHWDADILIHDHRIAILWNGPWHYRKLRSKHSVEQVQRRDQIKLNRIIANSWYPFVIQDETGQKNLTKVNSAFDEIVIFAKTCTIYS